MRGLIICVLWLLPAVATSQETGGVPLPENVTEFLDYHVGTWKMTPTDPAADWKGQAVFRWMPGKYCLMWSATIEGGYSMSGITGWDHANQRVVSQAFDSSGKTLTTTSKLTNNGKLDGQSVAVSPDGTRVTTTVKWTMKGRDEYWYRLDNSDGTVLELRYVRTGK